MSQAVQHITQLATRLARRSDVRCLIVLALFLVHLVRGLTHDAIAVKDDGTEYLRIAESLLAGHGFSFDGQNPVVGRPPGMLVFAAAYLSITGSLTGVHSIQLMLLFAAYCSIARLGALAFGTITGFATLCVLVGADPVRSLASNLLSEPLYLCLLGGGFLMLYQALRGKSLKRVVLAGAILGLASYVRPVVLFLPLAALIGVVLFARRYTYLMLALAAAHAAVVCPWIIRNALEFHGPSQWWRTGDRCLP